MAEITSLREQHKHLAERKGVLWGYLDLDAKAARLSEIDEALASEDIWQNRERVAALGREKRILERLVTEGGEIAQGLEDTLEFMELGVDEPSLLDDVASDLQALEARLAALEFERMFSRELDDGNAFVEIQSGSGGTEAQDWAEMLLRMYLRWGERRGFECQLTEVSEGEVAGIKSATIQVAGDYAYGWLRTETGVHRLVRLSPFDAGNRRHTSFASVIVTPEVDDAIEINIDPSDVRVDTYRASGAGGQHVNKSDSAVRLTHLPTGVAVQCQSERSQHQNRDRAWRQLRSKLYELEDQKRRAEQQAIEEGKSDIGWGNQIRNYVLDQARVKDLRTRIERGDPNAVLDGDLDEFMEASLKAGV
ncbi:MAG: peptide chain release factor 2 [Gammaproteobacteria bacterium]|nr:peptide chain release factor 2 [Gammaproteobacteria bacterium]